MSVLSSFRIFVNGFVNRSASVPQQMYLREIHSTPYWHLPKTVEEKLGLEKKPKRPTGAFFRYLKENLSSVRENNSNLKAREVVSLVAKMWNSMSDTQKAEYWKPFNNEKLDYMVQLREYKRNLSEDDAKRINETKAKIMERKNELKKAKQMEKLGKPKKPANRFLKFFLEHNRGRDRGDRKMTREEYKKYYQDVCKEWHALSDAERAKYSSTAEVEEYKNAMYEWEAKMIQIGRKDVIRYNTEVAPKLPSSKHKSK